MFLDFNHQAAVFLTIIDHFFKKIFKKFKTF
jgi:hypothetical protein